VPELISAYPPGIWLALLAIGGAETRLISLAIGTAQATILVTSLTAAAAHWRADTIDWALFRAWLPSRSLELQSA
jgi:uncharacterized membrane protein YfcA